MDPHDPPRRSYASQSEQARGGAARQQTQFTSQFGVGSELHSGQMQYPHELQVADAQRQHGQAFPTYQNNVVPTMGQSEDAVATASYDPLASFRSRTDAAETLASQFANPHSGQYFMSTQAAAAGPHQSQLSAAVLPSPYHQAQGYANHSPSTGSAYQGAVIEGTTAPAYSPYAVQSNFTPQQPQQILPQLSTQLSQPISPVAAGDTAFARYRAQVRGIFSRVRDGALRNIHIPLLQASQYLLGEAENLGLTRDDDTQRDFRIELWDEFNRAWLVTLQCQLDLTEEMARTGQTLADGQSIMPRSTLEYLGTELVRLCDGVERYGLVDYQIGVAEDEIVELLTRCGDALESPVEHRDTTADVG